ncbi:MAG: transposase [Actinobacteria bacterium]|nr:transposase [Actinomycetota bacterium]
MLSYKHPFNIVIENAIYMVTSATFERRNIFALDVNASEVVSIILKGRSLLHYWLLAFAVMPDHIHVVMKPRNKTLHQGIGSLKGTAARVINRKYNNEGKLWQRGYFARPIVSDDLLTREIWYVENNPIRSGLVANQHEYPFSSASFRHILDADVSACC